MRRVAFVLGNLRRGGAERQAVDLARHLSEHGWEPVFLLAENDGPLREEVRSLGLRIHDLGAEHWRRRTDPRFWINLAAVITRIRRICRDERIEVVHSYLFWQDCTTVPAAMISPGVRGIVTSRFSRGTFRGERLHYQIIGNALNLFTDAVICNSRGVRQDALARERLSPGKTVVIPNGVDADRFASAKPVAITERFPQLAGAQPLVGTLASLRPVKRQDLLLRAVARARKTHPRMKVLLAGDDLGWRAHLEQLVRDLGLRNAVAFAGGVSEPERWHAALDVFALTSDSEGFPNALLEAMAAGRPVVSTRVPGAEDAVLPGRTGFLVPRGDEERLARALCALAENPQAARRMGLAGQRRVRKEFTPERCAAAHSELYGRLAIS